MAQVVTTTYRYKRPPKRKAVALEVPAITPGKGRAVRAAPLEAARPPADGKPVARSSCGPRAVAPRCSPTCPT